MIHFSFNAPQKKESHMMHNGMKGSKLNKTIPLSNEFKKDSTRFFYPPLFILRTVVFFSAVRLNLQVIYSWFAVENLSR